MARILPQEAFREYDILPSMSFSLLANGDMDGPNFNSVEIDRYWDRR